MIALCPFSLREKVGMRVISEPKNIDVNYFLFDFSLTLALSR